MRAAPLAALVLAGLGAQPALGQDEPYDVLDFRMHHSSADRFKYYVDGRGQHPAGQVQMASVQAGVEAAYQTWQQVACAYPAFQSQGDTSANAQIIDARDPYDTFNVTAIWIRDANDPYYVYALGGGSAAAATIPLTYAGNLYQCDIYLNAVDFTWATLTPTPAGALDLQTYVLHEVGHCMGLGHSENYNDVMWPSNSYATQRRALTARDSAKLCELYPQTGAVGSPCLSDGGCVTTAQSGPLGCVRPPLPDGGTLARMCSRGCDPSGVFQCDAPFVCRAYSPQLGGKPGACLPTYGDYVTRVGAACTSDPQCGSAVGSCIVEGQLPSGYPAWDDGYCSQVCGTGQPGCPAGSSCLDLGGGALRCLKTCRLGSGDCRPGYTCSNVAQDLNLCVSSCHTDTDCNPPGANAFLCRVCDGTCLPRQSSTGQIGQACTADDQCGAGQVCLFFEGSAGSGVCSQSCASACTACPPGSSCHPLKNGDLYCLRDCTPGSCPGGLQCGLLQTGRGCIPGCTFNTDGPVGTTCFNNQCTTPGADGGTCALCGGGDAGNINPIVPPKPDGGSGGGSGGCGCSTAPPLALLIPLGLVLALLAGRRRMRTP